jgi:hypothetical protein
MRRDFPAQARVPTLAEMIRIRSSFASEDRLDRGFHDRDHLELAFVERDLEDRARRDWRPSPRDVTEFVVGHERLVRTDPGDQALVDR